MAAGCAKAGGRVLVAEDGYFIAKGLARDLEAMGFSVLGPAPSVAEALALLLGETPDGAVLDVNLRGEPVFPVADALAARGVPLVFATGYGAEAIPGLYGDAPRLEKPVQAAALVAALFEPAG